MTDKQVANFQYNIYSSYQNVGILLKKCDENKEI